MRVLFKKQMLFIISNSRKIPFLYPDPRILFVLIQRFYGHPNKFRSALLFFFYFYFLFLGWETFFILSVLLCALFFSTAHPFTSVLSPFCLHNHSLLFTDFLCPHPFIFLFFVPFFSLLFFYCLCSYFIRFQSIFLSTSWGKTHNWISHKKQRYYAGGVLSNPVIHSRPTSECWNFGLLFFNVLPPILHSSTLAFHIPPRMSLRLSHSPLPFSLYFSQLHKLFILGRHVPVPRVYPPNPY